ncbi:MFS transporter [Pseudonocardia nematodicida]|uniref:MFS transporter n=1 Tax=Pseudonocardia nematodicida TaxID=1206997 RepID=A0ABV1KFR5_9PSEU
MVHRSGDEGSRARVLVGTSVGTSLEWFDFLLYGALAGTVFPYVFFPSSSSTAALLASFATFGVGFIARPFGAAFFARVTDRVGRKHTMVVTLTIMGVASFAIACLPGYAAIGVLAPILLVVLRFVQGFSVGGETSSAQIMALEHAPDQRRGLYGAVVNLGNPIGQVLVASFILGAGLAVGEEALREWAWRVPFFAGALMAVVGYFIRRHIDESPAFVEAREIGARSASPLREVFAEQGGSIARMAAIWAPNTACSFVVTTWALSYITSTLGMSSTVTFSLLLGMNVIGLALVPLGGVLSDRFGRKRVLATCMTTSMLGSFALFPLLDTRNFALMLLAMVITQGAQLTAVGVMAALFAEPFPVPVRYSGHAAVYTLNNLVAGAPAPLVAAALLALTGSPWSIVALLASMYVVSLALLRSAPETRWLPFRDNFGTSVGASAPEPRAERT